MDKTKSLQIIFWLTLFTSFFVFKAATSDVNNPNHAAMDDDDDSDGTQDDVNPGDFIDNAVTDSGISNAEAIIYEIVAGVRDILPNNVIPSLSAYNLACLLGNPTGARLAASKYHELLPDLINFLPVDDINDEFFRYLTVFSDDIFLAIDRIPSPFIEKAVETQSLSKVLNLNGFIRKVENFEADVAFTLNPVFLLPHLFDFPRVNNPTYFMGRGLSFNPDRTGSRADFVIWNLSIQLFIYNLIHNNHYSMSDNYREICDIIIQELQSAHASKYPEFQYNYFGIADHEIFKRDLVFNSFNPLNLADNHVSINDLSVSVNLSSDFKSIKYANLSSYSRIIYRLLAYVAIFNPRIIDFDLADLFAGIIEASNSKDMTASEIDFLFSACLNTGRSDIIARIYIRNPNSLFRNTTEPLLTQNQDLFKTFVTKLDSLADILPFLLVNSGRTPYQTAIDMKDENFFRTAQESRCSVLINGLMKATDSAAFATSSTANANSNVNNDEIDNNYDVNVNENAMDVVERVPSRRNRDQKFVIDRTIFHSHFLTEKQFRTLNFGTSGSERMRISKTFTVPYPDINFFNERIDHLHQSLNLADYGVESWAASIEAVKDPLIKQKYLKNEKRIVELVLGIFNALHFIYKNPDADVEIRFVDHPGYGDGVFGEALALFSRAILLPQFKVFFYNTNILGFVPYPLLHPEIMGVLGYVNSWFIKNSNPLNWYLPNDYITFLFYEENASKSLQELIEILYPSIFYNLDNLISDLSNPLDYYPTAFRTHQPFSFEMGKPFAPFDIFNPQSCIDSKYSSLSIMFEASKIEFLDEVIDVNSKRRRRIEETKNEDNIIETKEGENDDDEGSSDKSELFERLNEQRRLKKRIISAMRFALSKEIIRHLLLGRFCFMRQFLRSFNEFNRALVDAEFYKKIQAAQEREITVDDLLPGLNYGAEMTKFKIFDEENQINLTPKEALETILQSYSSKLLRSFYWFCTGLRDLPLTGLASKPIKIIVTRSRLMPSAATCFRTFRFHTRPTLSANFDAMHTALTETSGYHYIEGREQVETLPNRQQNNSATVADVDEEDEEEEDENNIENDDEAVDENSEGEY